jgi:hypothetical protein
MHVRGAIALYEYTDKLPQLCYKKTYDFLARLTRLTTCKFTGFTDAEELK